MINAFRFAGCKQARVSAGLLATVLAVACNQPGDEGQPSADPSKTCRIRGHLVALAGEADPNRLVTLRLCPFGVETLVAGGSFASVSGAGTHVVLSGNPNPGADRAFQLVDGKLEFLRAIGDQAAFLPTVSAGGRVAYISGTPAAGNQAVHVLDSLSTTESEVVLRPDDSSGSIGWDGERLLYLHLARAGVEPTRGAEADATLTTVWPPADKGERPLRIPWPSGFTLGSQGRVAVFTGVASGVPRGSVVGADGQLSPLPSGWYPLDFGADGELFVATMEGTRVGVASPPMYDDVVELGTSAVGRIWYGAWLE